MPATYEEKLIGLSDSDIDNLSIEELQRLATADYTVRIAEARQSPIGLYRLMFTDEKGVPVVIKDFHYEWEQLFLQNRFSLVEAPRESTKSTFFLAYICWLLGHNPNIRMKLICCDEPTAIKRLSVIHIMLGNPVYQHVFPNLRKLTSKESIDEKRPNSAGILNVKRDFVSPEPTIEACGILTSGVGGRADLLACDDVVSESNALTNPSLRPKVIAKFLSDWLSTLVADGQVKYIGSPWHNQDLLAYLKRKASWPFKRYSHGKPGDPFYSIFPERWPSEALKERRRTLGPLHYARAYLCEALAEGTIAVAPSALHVYHQGILTQEKLNRGIVINVLDPSSGKKLDKGELDYTGVAALLYVQALQDEDNNANPNEPPYEIFIVDAYQALLPHIYQAKLVWQLAQQWQASYCLIEAAGMQALDVWLEEQRIHDPTLPLIEIIAVAPGSKSKGQRLQQVVPLLARPDGDCPVVYFHPAIVEEHPQEFLIDVGGTPFEALKDLRSQLLGFPTKHDDILDAVVYGLRWIHENLVVPVDSDGAGNDNNAGSATADGISCISI